VNAVTRFLLVSLAAIVLFICCALLPGPDESEAAQDVADDYAQAVRDGGVAKCAALGRVPLWTKSGDLVCRATDVVVEASL
jgi:hypothetical protein